MKPVSRTYYCCGVRALDAASPGPVCGDRFAERFMTPEAWALFEPHLRTSTFNRRYGGKIGKLLKDLGAPYGRLQADEVELIEEAGFRLTLRQSVVGRAAELGMLRIPRWLLSTLLRTLRDGYTIGVFESVSG